MVKDDHLAKPDRVNFKIYRDSLPSWEDIYDFGASYLDNLFMIAKKGIALPNEEFQMKVFLIYSLIPNALANVVPYLQLYGISGSGKSTLSFFASIIHGVEIYTSTSTFASIRNALNSKKYDGGFENNIIMIWDDIDVEIFNEHPDLYRMFKIGYSRQTDKMSVASSGGKNIDFRVFCPKIFSSIHPFFSDVNLQELTRRLIFITTRKAILLGKTELLDFTAFIWKDFNKHYEIFWQDENNCIKFADYRKALSGKKPSYIPPERWQVSIDLLATGLAFGVFFDIKEGIKFIETYWESHDEQIQLHKGALHELLESLIKNESEKIDDLQILGVNKTLTISPTTIKSHINRWEAMGQLETHVNPKILNKIMGQLGLRLSAAGWIKIEKNSNQNKAK